MSGVNVQLGCSFFCAALGLGGSTVLFALISPSVVAKRAAIGKRNGVGAGVGSAGTGGTILSSSSRSTVVFDRFGIRKKRERCFFGVEETYPSSVSYPSFRGLSSLSTAVFERFFLSLRLRLVLSAVSYPVPYPGSISVDGVIMKSGGA